MLVSLSLAAIVIIAVVLTVVAVLRNDVAIDAPPGKLTRLRTYLTENVAQTRPDHSFPELRTRVFGHDETTLLRRVARACAVLGWEAIRVDEDRLVVRAQVRTPLLGFTDDVEAKVEADGAGGARLDIRSASRVGRGDLGANLRHVLDLYGALTQARADVPEDV